VYDVKIMCSKQEEQLTGQKYITQKIIKDASGFALPGEVLYIMGASGAGKTSLLNILSDRISTGKGAKVKGKILINDKIELRGPAFGALASYVMQDDVLFKSFTPREALTFAARLKLTNMSIKDQDRRVLDLLGDLNLMSVADQLIGGGKVKTISKSEIKRTAIGVELITDPQLVLLDEPTSGLDSFKALSIVRLLRNLARKRGKTIISTIH
jgi:ABC-type multidrug transport system ATPase subunit